MPRPRKRHVQQELVFRTWGGERLGAGRKQVNERKSQPHRSRPAIQPRDAVHVTLRVGPEVARMRRRDGFYAIRKAMNVVLARPDFRIVHASIQSNHIHLLVEAEHKMALARGMQAFQISAAKHLNAAQPNDRGRRRRGSVFVDRYHAEIIKSPTKARRTLNYVLNNWRHHREDRAPYARAWKLDPYSTAICFDGWAEGSWGVPADYDPLPVCRPQSWLLRDGWRRGGGAITIAAVPAR